MEDILAPGDNRRLKEPLRPPVQAGGFATNGQKTCNENETDFQHVLPCHDGTSLSR